MIPPINKTNRVTKNPATSIDQIITKTIADTQFKSGIIQADLSDDFPILFTNQTNENVVEKHNLNISFIKDVMTKNQQTLSKSCMK